MSILRSFFYLLLKLPLRLLVRSKIVQDADTSVETQARPVFYVVSHQSASDLLTLQTACKQQQLPDPLSKIKINGKLFDRILCLEKPKLVFSCFKTKNTSVK